MTADLEWRDGALSDEDWNAEQENSPPRKAHKPTVKGEHTRIHGGIYRHATHVQYHARRRTAHLRYLRICTTRHAGQRAWR